MLCHNCQTELPDDAVACWKCGTPTSKAISANIPKSQRDILHIVAAFFVAAVLFVCVGWPIPFVVWGAISASASALPQWASISGVISAIVLIGTAIAFIAAVWWGSYWVIARLFATPNRT